MTYMTLIGSAYEFYLAIEWGFKGKNIGTNDKELR